MIAYLTFLRKNKDYLHLLGIKNPTNIISLQNLNLTSGQPVIVIIKDDSFYYAARPYTHHSNRPRSRCPQEACDHYTNDYQIKIELS